AVRGVGDPIRRIFAILEGYRQRLLDTGCSYGCPIGRLALEIDHGSRKTRSLIASNFAAWTGAIHGFLLEAKDRLPRGTDLEALSQFVLTVMEGAVMQSRAHGSIEPFDASVRQLEAYFRLLEGKRKGT